MKITKNVFLKLSFKLDYGFPSSRLFRLTLSYPRLILNVR